MVYANFGTVEDAQKYINALTNSPLAGKLLQDGDSIMYMSHTNFKVAYGERRMEDYLNYFNYILGKK